ITSQAQSDGSRAVEKSISSGGAVGGAAAARAAAEGLAAARRPPLAPRFAPQFAALDLGTNNCRLLVARPAGVGFRVIDAFSRIVRLGEGLSATGALSGEAMERTLEALRVCAAKISARNVTAARYVATEACRRAANCEDFLARVEEEVGLAIEIISTAE